jgi:cell division protein FtsA
MNKTFAILDLRCNDISGVAVRWEPGKRYAIRAFVRSDAKGLRKGVVTDLSRASDAIMEILRKLKDRSGDKIQDVYVSMSSPSISMRTSSATLLVSKYVREISSRDVKKVTKQAAVIKMPVDRDQMHKIVRNYTVDGEPGIRNPVGLDGVKLEADLNVLTIDSSVIRNIEKSVTLAGYNLQKVMFSLLAVANRTLVPEQKEKGALIVNICGDLTEMAVFKKGILYNCRIIRSAIDRSTKECALRICSFLKDFTDIDDIAEVIVTGEEPPEDRVLVAMEEELGKSVKCGGCSSREGESLPENRMAYLGCLGVIDLLKEERENRIKFRNIVMRALNRVLTFLDEYF